MMPGADFEADEIRRLIDGLRFAPAPNLSETVGTACPLRGDEPTTSLPREEMERLSKTFSGGCFVLSYDSRKKARG